MESHLHAVNEPIAPGQAAPDELGVSVPVNVSYTAQSSVPRLKAGSDIQLVRQEDIDNERATSSTLNASTSFSKTPTQNGSLLTNFTLDRIDLGVTYGRSRRIAPSANSRDSSRTVSYTGRFGYDLTPRERHTVRPFGWASPLIPESVRETEFLYLPTSLSFNVSSTFSADSSWTMQRLQGRDTVRVRGKQTFSMGEAYRLGIQPFQSIQADYDLSLTRNLQEEYAGEINPVEVVRAVGLNIFRGNEIQRAHNSTHPMIRNGPGS